MSVRKYGIYLAYPPTVDLRAEGLSRHLAEFLKAAQDRSDIRFVIACPSWVQARMDDFCEEFGIRSEHFDIIAPRQQPWLLRFYKHVQNFKKRPKRKGKIHFLLESLWQSLLALVVHIARWIAGARSKLSLIFLAIVAPVALPVLLLVAIVQSFLLLLRLPLRLEKKLKRRLEKPRRYVKILVSSFAVFFTYDFLATKLYRLMADVETSLMRDLIEGQHDILAWYCPTAFWPQFNQISAPRLMCVPDVVMLHFPLSFASIGGNRLLGSFRQVEQAIRGCDQFVTYSETIKWQTLVKHYQIRPEKIGVIPHGAMSLYDLVMVKGFPDNEVATNTFCRTLFKSALRKALAEDHTDIYRQSNFRFLFYASQVRPNKNILSLLRSYEYLLRRCYIVQKLVLTGNPDELSGIVDFIDQHNLHYDVVCLRGLSGQELAACYRLADIVVNPSLSEGGFPFTFAEALSVGTPVVMARIDVTEEVIKDKELQQIMLFDPYDWKSMADRIEWALENREYLLSVQKPFYHQFAQRSWRNVVDEYVDLLDKIAMNPPKKTRAKR